MSALPVFTLSFAFMKRSQPTRALIAFVMS